MELEQLFLKLDQADEHTRAAAAELIAKLENAVPYTVPLIRALAVDHEDLCQSATSALESVELPDLNDLPEFLNILNDYLHDQSENSVPGDCAFWAATMIGLLGQQAAAAAESLDQAASSAPDRPVQKRAKWALGQIREAA